MAGQKDSDGNPQGMLSGNLILSNLIVGKTYKVQIINLDTLIISGTVNLLV